MSTTQLKRAFNFNAGPAALPLPVLEKAQNELLNYKDTGMSVMELSHRSKDFMDVLERAEASLRRLMRIPENYDVLFLQGGASLQFAMIPMNLAEKGKPVNVIHSGYWTKKAIAELKKVADHRVVASSEDNNFTTIPTVKVSDFDANASYVYITSNNTIHGTQWQLYPDTGSLPLVADMTSDIASREIDVSRFGIIFAGAQKNLGPSGVTVVIIRKDLAEKASESIPTILQYRTHIKAKSLYNTAPTFGIYMCGLVFEWMKKEGGVKVLEKRNQEKAKLLYDFIDQSDFYKGVVEKPSRSMMNVVFRIKDGDETLEKKLLTEATTAGLIGLKGHRSTGGLRASIYTPQPVEGVKALMEFLSGFKKRNF